MRKTRGACNAYSHSRRGPSMFGPTATSSTPRRGRLARVATITSVRLSNNWWPQIANSARSHAPQGMCSFSRVAALSMGVRPLAAITPAPESFRMQRFGHLPPRKGWLMRPAYVGRHFAPATRIRSVRTTPCETVGHVAIRSKVGHWRHPKF